MAVLTKGFNPKEGPFYKCLSIALAELNVDKQAYHGGTFVGNHVHKLLKVLVPLHSIVIHYLCCRIAVLMS